MVEVIVAMVILATGVLGLAGTTALIVRQITLSDVSTERAAAVQSVLERLRAMEYDSVDTGSDSIGRYDLDWTVSEESASKQITLVTTGPGLGSGGGFPGLQQNAVDTFVYRIIRP